MTVRIDKTNRAKFDPMQRARDMRRMDSEQRRGNVSLKQRLAGMASAITAAGEAATAAALTPPSLPQVNSLPDAETSGLGTLFIKRNNGALDGVNVGITDADDRPILVALNVLGPGSLDPQVGLFLDIDDPGGIAVDTDGNIYVTAGIQVRKFSPAGDLLAAYIPGGAVSIATFSANYGTSGSGTAPNFDGPRQVVVDAGGFIYVADSINDRLVKLTSAGAHSAVIGTAGTGNGQLDNPSGISLDTTGNIYICDYNNARLQKFSPAGSYLAKFIGFGSPRNICWDDGFAYFTDDANQRLLRCSDSFIGSGTVLAGGGVSAADGFFTAIYGIACDGEFLYVSDATLNRIQKFTLAGQFVAKWGVSGSGDGQLSGPRGIAVHPVTGLIYVADSGNDRICCFTNTGSFVGKFGVTGSGSGQFNLPTGLAFNAVGTKLYVSDETNDKISALDVVTPDSELADVAIDGTGKLYVTDRVAGCFYVLNTSGVVTNTIGTPGTGNGQFDGPEGIALNGSDDVYVVDRGNHRVQRFTAATFAYAAQTGGLGPGNGTFNGPAGLAIDAGNRLFVVDTGNRIVQILDSALAWTKSFGGYGNSDGQFQTPWAAAFDREGRLWVTDRARKDVQAFDVNHAFLDKATGINDPTGIAFNANNGLGYISELGYGYVRLLQLPLQNFPALLTNLRYGDGLEWRPDIQHFINVPGPNGLVLIDGPLAFSASASVNFDDYFDGTYNSYVVAIGPIQGSAVADIGLQFRLAGVNQTAANYYSTLGLSFSNATVFTNAKAAAAASWLVWSAQGAILTDGHIWLLISAPALAAETTFGIVSAAGRFATGVIVPYGGGMHNLATAYDGFRLFPALGTITGTAAIFGIREAL